MWQLPCSLLVKQLDGRRRQIAMKAFKAPVVLEALILLVMGSASLSSTFKSIGQCHQ
jgi:hypothetical protein